MAQQLEQQNKKSKQEQAWSTAGGLEESKLEKSQEMEEHDVSTSTLKYMEKRLMSAFLSKQEKDRNSHRSDRGRSSFSNHSSSSSSRSNSSSILLM